MEKVNIYLADGSFEGRVVISGQSSKIKMIRTCRSNVNQYLQDLKLPGVYFLIIGSDIYVGESDNIETRILNSHRDNIHTNWQSVICFSCTDPIELRERRFLENAFCEYIRRMGWNCITRKPKPENCNQNYRKIHYLNKMTPDKRDACNQYFEDIKYYLSFIKSTVFYGCGTILVSQASHSARSSRNTVYFKCCGSGACAMGYDSPNGFTVCKDSIVSREIGTSLSQRQKELRLRLINDGTILGNKFTREFEFVSRATASNVILGRSSNAHIEWKREEEQV